MPCSDGAGDYIGGAFVTRSRGIREQLCERLQARACGGVHMFWRCERSDFARPRNAARGGPASSRDPRASKFLDLAQGDSLESRSRVDVMGHQLARLAAHPEEITAYMV